jgi:hypothetical protein
MGNMNFLFNFNFPVSFQVLLGNNNQILKQVLIINFNVE